MNQVNLIATAKFGLESIVKNELISLGYDDIQVSNGRIDFKANLSDIPKTNIWLRCADRILLLMDEFEALTFDELYEKTKAIPWENLITRDGKFTVTGKSIKSQLRSVRSCQSIVKKAVVDRLKEKYKIGWFEETGPEFNIQVSLLKDLVTLTVDSSGVGLHKRGYRAEGGEAPLKETLAAALVTLSVWSPDQILIDPMCGSGTILIEAAMLARNIAPGLKRNFASEKWPLIQPTAWVEAREDASTAVKHIPSLQIMGYDIDGKIIETAKANAQLAGVLGGIYFDCKDLKDIWIDRQYGVLITNPPYGIRIAEFKEINNLYIHLNKIFRKKTGWSVYVLTADEKFPRYFKRAKPEKVRKLYNGTIKVNYYQYLGEIS